MTNTKLTNEEIARVFAMYFNSDIQLHEIGESAFISRIESINRNNILAKEYNFILKWSFQEVKLLLTPLSKITDEHAIELSVCCFPDGNDYDYLHGAATGKAIVTTIKSGRQTNTFYPMARMYDCFQYLMQQGYAVPLFFGLNHWANGKTAIELGIAIEAT